LNIGTAPVATGLAVAACALLAPPVPNPSGSGSGWSPRAVAAGSGVVVNEFTPGGYVKPRNATPSTVDISGFHLVASTSFTGAPADQTYGGTMPDGGAVLLDRDYRWTDGAAVTPDSPCGKGTPAPACPLAATARDALSTDTGDNVADFACRDRSPGVPNPAP
jgi:hypothetical protein